MLVLQGKKNESIKIGENIEVTFLDVCKGVVKIGISAPKDVKILRLKLSEDDGDNE